LKDDGQKLEKWKSDMEIRLRELDGWKQQQQGAQGTLKYLASGLFGAVIVFILTRIWPAG
jgi:hypothetical protein